MSRPCGCRPLALRWSQVVSDQSRSGEKSEKSENALRSVCARRRWSAGCPVIISLGIYGLCRSLACCVRPQTLYFNLWAALVGGRPSWTSRDESRGRSPGLPARRWIVAPIKITGLRCPNCSHRRAEVVDQAPFVVLPAPRHRRCCYTSVSRTCTRSPRSSIASRVCTGKLASRGSGPR